MEIFGEKLALSGEDFGYFGEKVFFLLSEL